MTGSHPIAKKHLRFSVIDFIIILLVLAGIIGVAVRFDLVGRLFSKTSQVDAEITFIAEAISPAEAAVFTEGTTFYHQNERFGTLLSASAETALIYAENDAGVLVSYEDETLLDLTGTLSCRVLPTDDGYLLTGNRYIAAGSSFLLQADGIAVTVTVIAIEEIPR